jgi:hypothetical protein
MTSSEEKRAIIAKLSAELQNEADDLLVENLLQDIARGPRKMWDSENDQDKRIVACSVSQKYGYATIDEAVLKKVANRLSIDAVYQFHVSDPDADYCGDGSYTWLKLGESKAAKIQKLQEELRLLTKET